MAFVTGQGMGEYCVDIVMCIDATGSMAPIINEVKDNALSFYQRFIDSMEENDKEVAELRKQLSGAETERVELTNKVHDLETQNTQLKQELERYQKELKLYRKENNK